MIRQIPKLLILTFLSLPAISLAQEEMPNIDSRLKALEKQVATLTQEIAILKKQSYTPHYSEQTSGVIDEEITIHISRDKLDRALENLPKAFSQARAVPYFRNGRSIGARLFAIRRESIFEQLGLMNGDIITKIDDEPILDTSQIWKLIEIPKEQSSRTIILERSGRGFKLQIQID